MKILITGSSGFIGSALLPFLNNQGDDVIRMVRSTPKAGELFWDPEAGRIDASGLEGFDGVIHLAGDPIAEGRWTPEKKARMRKSRTEGTGLLAETVAHLKHPPKVMVCASAIGYYGDRGDELLQENSPAGTGFLAEIGQLWEEAAEPAARAGIRVVHLRIGVVLSPAGGALKKMLPPFRLGIGGKLGSGKQFMSWIALDDIVGALHHTLITESLRGPVNGVAPHPVTNAEFTKILGRVLHRPTLFPVPPFALRLMFGELADAVLLASMRVEPSKLLQTDYRFHYPDLEQALGHLLKKA